MQAQLHTINKKPSCRAMKLLQNGRANNGQKNRCFGAFIFPGGLLCALFPRRTSCTGPVPKELGAPTKLETLWLRDNNLTGENTRVQQVELDSRRSPLRAGGTKLPRTEFSPPATSHLCACCLGPKTSPVYLARVRVMCGKNSRERTTK